MLENKAKTEKRDADRRASASVVGSGKRKSMKGGRKGIGQMFREGLRKTVELKKLGELEQAKNVKLFQAKNAEAQVVGSGKRKRARGRPKGSKNKGIKGGNIFDGIKHSLAADG